MAAALAGVASFQACTVNNNNNNDPDEQDGGESNGGGTKNTGATANSGGSGDEGGAPAAVGGSSGAVGGAGEVVGGATGEGGATTVGGATSEGGAGQGGAASCDDTVGTPTCDNVSQDCINYCNAALANLKPAVAAAAIACLEADATCNDGYGCLADATAQACAEDVTAACEAAVTSCGEPDPGDPACAQLLSGFNAEARAEVITCTEESCFSVYSCAEGLFFE